MSSQFRYVVYNRRSMKSKSKQHLSLKSQQYESDELARELKLNVVATFSASESARKKGRRAFNEMLAFIKKGKADSIIAWHPNRLSRNSHDSALILELLEDGVPLPPNF